MKKKALSLNVTIWNNQMSVVSDMVNIKSGGF